MESGEWRVENGSGSGKGERVGGLGQGCVSGSVRVEVWVRVRVKFWQVLC